MSKYNNRFASYNHYACLCVRLLLPAYLQINTNFSQGDKTSTAPAALPILHSGPLQRQESLLTHSLTMQYATHIIKMLLNNTVCSLFTLSPHQTPNGAQLPLQPLLERYAAILAHLQSHRGSYCNRHF